MCIPFLLINYKAGSEINYFPWYAKFDISSSFAAIGKVCHSSNNMYEFEVWNLKKCAKNIAFEALCLVAVSFAYRARAFLRALKKREMFHTSEIRYNVQNVLSCRTFTWHVFPLYVLKKLGKSSTHLINTKLLNERNNLDERYTYI